MWWPKLLGSIVSRGRGVEKEGVADKGNEVVGGSEVLGSKEGTLYMDMVKGNRTRNEPLSVVGVHLKVLICKYRSKGEDMAWAHKGFVFNVISGESIMFIQE